MNSPSPRSKPHAGVTELSDPYGNFMINPLPPGSDGVCPHCLTFTNAGWDTCWRCDNCELHANAILPISYSPHGGQLHHALSGYKRAEEWKLEEIRRHFQRDIAAIVWRFLREHEPCLAHRAGVSAFDVVATVPSGDPARDEAHPLRRVVVGVQVGHTRDRHERLLIRSSKIVEPRTVDIEKYEVSRSLAGGVLLVDDTFASGASVHSAAGALRRAGAESVGVLVVGRHMRPEWGSPQQKRLESLPRPFDWGTCAFHESPTS